MNVNSHWSEAYIGLGSNLENPVEQILLAIGEIAALEGVKRIAASPLYRSLPVGPQDQPDYINAVMRITTCLAPMELLSNCQSIENQHGRERLIRWGARTLDLDILLYNNEIIDLPELTVPHPELPNRNFVLFPLADIAPQELVIPGKGCLTELLAACSSEGLQRVAP